jgi:uncharacterized protein YxeA
MKNTPRLVIGILIVGVVIASYFVYRNNNVEQGTGGIVINDQAVSTTTTTTGNNPIEMCYRYYQKTPIGLYDRAYLKLSLTGSEVSGEYNNLPAEKDSKTGTFTGAVGPMDEAISARTADVWWNVSAEGMQAVEQLKIQFGEGSAAALFGEMMDSDDGRYIYRNPSNLTPGFQMSQTDCEAMTDRMTVDNYLRKNIKTIAPKAAPVGGTWFVTSTTVDTINKTGLVEYEDGHVIEKRPFSYVLTGGNVVITWK